MIENLNDDKYLKALSEINDQNYDEIAWLYSYFELYKTTLNWPDDLPPLKRCYLKKGQLKEKFNSVYREILGKNNYQFDNKKQTLTVIRKG